VKKFRNMKKYLLQPGPAGYGFRLTRPVAVRYEERDERHFMEFHVFGNTESLIVQGRTKEEAEQLMRAAIAHEYRSCIDLKAMGGGSLTLSQELKESELAGLVSATK
jgi:hypothetical protein